jgi:hypothetical protein
MHRRRREHRWLGQAKGGRRRNDPKRSDDRTRMDELRSFECKLCTICDNTGDVGWHPVCVEITINVASILKHELSKWSEDSACLCACY